MLLLDSGALSAIANGPRERRERVLALIIEMRRRHPLVGTCAAVLAELVRGRHQDSGVFSALRRERIEVYPVDSRVGVRAGQLLGAARAGSELAVDAFIVAVADLAGGAVIASADPADLERLSSHATAVTVSTV